MSKRLLLDLLLYTTLRMYWREDYSLPNLNGCKLILDTIPSVHMEKTSPCCCAYGVIVYYGSNKAAALSSGGRYARRVKFFDQSRHWSEWVWSCRVRELLIFRRQGDVNGHGITHPQDSHFIHQSNICHVCSPSHCLIQLSE